MNLILIFPSLMNVQWGCFYVVKEWSITPWEHACYLFFFAQQNFSHILPSPCLLNFNKLLPREGNAYKCGKLWTLISIISRLWIVHKGQNGMWIFLCRLVIKKYCDENALHIYFRLCRAVSLPPLTESGGGK